MAPNWFTNLFIEEAKAALESKGNSGSSSGGSSNESWIGDGNTHIWITLSEGRTSPMLGVCPNGTVTVDWGDGTSPDVLTGTSTSTAKWTPTHDYAEPGDYVITLTVDGETSFYGTSGTNEYSGILRHSSITDERNSVYKNSVRMIEIGNGITSIGSNAFNSCYNITSIKISGSVTTINESAFKSCYSLTYINIPETVTCIGDYAFSACYMLASINIPDSVTKIGKYAFRDCYSLTYINIPETVTSIGDYAFSTCYSLSSVSLPGSMKIFPGNMFRDCYGLTSINIPASVYHISGNAFYSCTAMRYYDFTNHTSIPTLASAAVFESVPADCKILVPAALYDEWTIATNWSTFASKIVAV